VLRKALLTTGYRVIEARGASEAIGFAAEYAGAIDLLATELALPEMRGDELAARLRSRRPTLRTLLLHDGSVAPDEVPQGAALEKPFAVDALQRAVGDLLAAGGRAAGTAPGAPP
jgi:DNA-binding NtrC family response regulator